MLTLFPILSELPPGFYYFPDFISEEEEEELVRLIQGYALKHMIFQGFEAKRKVMSFGHDYHFNTRDLSLGIPIPAEFKPLISKVALSLNMPAEKFAEVLLTEYAIGTVINWHRDAPPFEKIAGVSLLSDCTFKLRPYDKAKQNRSSVRSFTVKRRSLYMMEKEARNDWEHSIAPVKALRYSITIRTLRTPMP
jgi:alkylated DNA repair dioxygenase AlkB